MQQDFPDSGVDREFPVTLLEHSRTPLVSNSGKGEKNQQHNLVGQGTETRVLGDEVSSEVPGLEGFVWGKSPGAECTDFKSVLFD